MPPITISRSLWRKIVVTLLAMLGFVVIYQATIHDSRTARQASVHDPTSVPMPGTRLEFNATAYCKGTTTASGVNVQTGIAAADPAILPVGSVVSVATGSIRYNGVYTIMDTGSKVGGRLLDLYMWSCDEARSFGRQRVQVTVLRLGWNPRASTPGLIGKLFRLRERPLGPETPVAPPPAAVPPGMDPTAPGETPAQTPAPADSAAPPTAPSGSAPASSPAPGPATGPATAPATAPASSAPLN